MEPAQVIQPNDLQVDVPYFIRNKQTNELQFQNPCRYCGSDPNPPNFPRFNLAPEGQILCIGFNPANFMFQAAVVPQPPGPGMGGGRRKRKGSRKSKKTRKHRKGSRKH